VTWRSWFIELLPPWLRRAVGEAFVGALGDQLDVAATKVKDASKTAFVREAPSDALNAHGWARSFERFAGEGDSAYRARLALAWSWWATAGTKAAPLDIGGTGGLQGLLEAALGPSVTVQIKAYRDPYRGPLRRDYWSELWVVLSDVPWTRRTWGAPAAWGDGETWASTATRAEVEMLKSLVRRFKSAHEWCPAIVVVFAGRTWGDSSTWGGASVTWDASADALYWPIHRT
jgi:hypothetical protein